MRGIFVELPPFERHRRDYLDDAGFRRLQEELLLDPYAGDVIKGTGGLRKMRFADGRRGKGKRGGIRIIYYWWLDGGQYWLFAIYGKNEMSDLKETDRKALADLLRREVKARGE